MTDDQTPEDAGGSPARPPGVIFGACVLLVIVGLGSATLSLPAVVDPDAARCHLSRSWLEDANTDDRDWNNVDTGGRLADDIPCDEAIRLADSIPLEEDGDRTVAVPSRSVVQVQSGLVLIMGAGQALSGWWVLRRMSRQARNLAVAFSAAGLILQALGVISLAVFAFVVYALVFSGAAREIWPRERRQT